MVDSDGEQGQSWDDRTQQDVVGRQIALLGDIQGKARRKKRAQQHRTALLPGHPEKSHMPRGRGSWRNFLQSRTLSGLCQAKIGSIPRKKRV